MRDLNKSIGRERAVYSTDGELKMLGEGAQQKRRQLSETSALGKIRLQWSCAGPHTVIFVFCFFFGQLCCQPIAHRNPDSQPLAKSKSLIPFQQSSSGGWSLRLSG